MKQSKKKILDVIIIGMGFSGVCSAIKLLENKIDNFEIHEKSTGVGGTWNDNIYPGAACDVPSHLYCFSFEPNPNWTRRYAKQPEIKQYIEHCVEKYNINKYANFSSKVISIQLIEKSSLWLIKFLNGNEIKAKHVIHAAGGIHKPTIPSFKNLSQYDGTVMHTAQWNNEVAIKDKRIAVIGSAASAIQVIPEIAKIASKVDVFQRTPNYIIPRGDRAYTDKEKMRFKRFPWLLKLYRWFFYMRLELLTFPIIKKNSFIGKKAAKNINKYMRSKIHDSSLHEYFEPKYDLGCKRILLSDDLFNAINRENVEVINSKIDYFNTHGLTTADGADYNFDVVIMATGFDIRGHMYSINLTGKNNLTLKEAWSKSEEAYRGCCISDFPNFYMVTGPNTGAGTISLIHIIEKEVNYIIKLIKLAGKTKTIEVKKESQRLYNLKIQKKLDKTVWSSGCDSWYLNDEGKNITLYPEHGRSFKKQLNKVIYDDFIITERA